MSSLSSWIMAEPFGGLTGVAFLFGGMLIGYYRGGKIPFIPLFESPQIDFLVKRYVEFKKRTSENPDLEIILLSKLPPEVT